MKTLFVLVAGLGLLACGPAKRDPNQGDDGSNVDASMNSQCTNPQPEICGDGVDNDCDGNVDCADVDCSGVGGCPVCGAVDDPEATPIVLPDGVVSGNPCSTDTDCPTATPNCIIYQDSDNGNATVKQCHASYTSTLNFIGFPTGATLDDTSKLLKVCVNMEHSYLHDMHMELLSPPDAGGVRRKIVTNAFIGQVGPEIFVGKPNDNDEGHPVAGVGMIYCWTAAATVDMDTAGASGPSYTDPNSGNSAPQLQPGDYKPSAAFTGLQGAPLNGEWIIRITDIFPIDNGFLFGWSIAFDPSLVSDCSGPIIN